MEEPYLKTIIFDDIMYYDDYSMKSSASETRKTNYANLKIFGTNPKNIKNFQKILKEPYPKIELQQKYFVWTKKHLITTLREKCRNKEFFLVHIFSHSDWIRRDTQYLSVFSPNAGKYEPEKLRISTLFTQC